MQAYCTISLSALENEHLVEALLLPLRPSVWSKVHAARLTGALTEIDMVSIWVVRVETDVPPRFTIDSLQSMLLTSRNAKARVAPPETPQRILMKSKMQYM